MSTNNQSNHCCLFHPQARHSYQRLSPRTTLHVRQERAVKTLRKMGRFDDNEMLDDRRTRCIRPQTKPWMTSPTARTHQIPNSIHCKENMNTIILPMAYRRYRHSVRRSSMAERTLPKMKDLETSLKRKPRGRNSRLPNVSVNVTNNPILSRSNNLSNRSVITVKGPPPYFHCTLLCRQGSRFACRENRKGVNHP